MPSAAAGRRLAPPASDRAVVRLTRSREPAAPEAAAAADSRGLEVPPGLAGLTAGQADQLLAIHGPNRWVPPDPLAWLRDTVHLLLDPMAIMLAIAAAIYAVLGETRDAVVLALALVPVLGVDVLLEARSRSALARLARAAAPAASAVRDGRVQTIPLEAIVPGDLLALREGHTVPADGVVLWAANLAADESPLTGESEPQAKIAAPGVDDAPEDARFLAGSVAVSGHGFGRVTATGSATRYGAIAALVARTAPAPSPLQRQAARLVRALGALAVVIAFGLVPLSLARGDSWSESLLGAVSLTMAAMPEEFLVVLTLFLSVGAWRLAARGMLVRRLASVETLGSTTVICTDKTGTLTRGTFEIADHLVLDPALSDRAFFEIAVLACEPHPVDALEQAIAAIASRHGVSAGALAGRWTLVRDHDFDPAGKHMSHVWRAGHEFVVAAKGAVEGVLAHTAADPQSRDRVLEAHRAFAARGLRVLAVAARRAGRIGSSREDDERDLVLCGLIGFQDPLRPEVPAAVDQCQRAGIRVKMITGDHALTAHAIAEAAGIAHDDELVVTGDELAALGEVERAARIERSAIFARTSPEQKFLIVDALKRAGATVAMTGDGVNDAPALRRADIGIAMGRRGTDVARATADLVLLDDDFASIVAAIGEGRHIVENVQRAFLYLIAFHVPIVALAIVAPLAGVPLVLWPIHLVWLELIVHPVSAFVFQAERASTAVMERPPRDGAAPLLPRAAVRRSAVSGGLLAAATFGAYWWQLPTLGDTAARGQALIVLLAGYETLLFVERLALTGSMPRIPRTPVFWTLWIASALSLWAILAIPSLSSVFNVEAPGLGAAASAACLGVASVAWRTIGLHSPRSMPA